MTDWKSLEPDDFVAASEGQSRWTSASVEEAVPELGVIWIRETQSGVTGPGDANAGGAPTAATITGTDQATPLTTMRRLNPASPMLVIFCVQYFRQLRPRVVSNCSQFGTVPALAAFSRP